MGFVANVKEQIQDTLSNGEKHWWVYGRSHAGRVVILGPHKTEEGADIELSKLIEGETYCLPTRNVERAKGMIRRIIVQRSNEVNAAGRFGDADDYVGHRKVPEYRERGKYGQESRDREEY